MRGWRESVIAGLALALPASPEDSYAEAFRALERGTPEQAVQILDSGSGPLEGRAALLLGVAHYRLEHGPAALEAFQRAARAADPEVRRRGRFNAARVATSASVFWPPGRAMTSSESAEIATLVLRAMAASRCPCTSARLSRERAYTGNNTTMSVSSTAAALTPAIFQRKGSRDARIPSDEDRAFLHKQTLACGGRQPLVGDDARGVRSR